MLSLGYGLKDPLRPGRVPASHPEPKPVACTGRLCSSHPCMLQCRSTAASLPLTEAACIHAVYGWPHAHAMPLHCWYDCMPCQEHLIICVWLLFSSFYAVVEAYQNGGLVQV